MNPVLWAAMQPQDVLHQVDLMLPDLVDEDQVELLDIIQNTKQDIVNSSWIQSQLERGGALTAIGLAMLAVPDVVVYSVGAYFGGPVGGWIAIAVWDGIAITLIVVDLFILN